MTGTGTDRGAGHALEGLRSGLERQGLSFSPTLPGSAGRFRDGLRYRFEIPSCEGPKVLAAVVEESERLQTPVRRVSQGSGVMMLSDSELAEMAAIGAESGIEISLFVGPRSGWDIGGQSHATDAVFGSVRGSDGLAACMAEAHRAAEAGIRGMLVADLGLLTVLARMKETGDLPAEMILKTSVMMPVSNPATARQLEEMGAGTMNLSTDLTLAEIAEIRAATSLPLDLYVEVPEDQGGFVRFYDVPELVRIASPVYVKLGIRNAPVIYPTGVHLEPTAVNLGRERVRRASLCLRLIRELSPELAEGFGDARPDDLGVPVR